METTPAQRQDPRGLVADVQSHHQGLDQLLRELLQIGALPHLAASEPNPGQMGHEEIQEVETPSQAGGILAGANSPKGTLVVSALADGSPAHGWMMGAR